MDLMSDITTTTGAYACRLCENESDLLDLSSEQLKYAAEYRQLIYVMTGIQVDPTEKTLSVVCRPCIRRAMDYYHYRRNARLRNAQLVRKRQAETAGDGTDNDVEFVSVLVDCTMPEVNPIVTTALQLKSENFEAPAVCTDEISLPAIADITLAVNHDPPAEKTVKSEEPKKCDKTQPIGSNANHGVPLVIGPSGIGTEDDNIIDLSDGNSSTDTIPAIRHSMNQLLKDRKFPHKSVVLLQQEYPNLKLPDAILNGPFPAAYVRVTRKTVKAHIMKLARAARRRWRGPKSRRQLSPIKNQRMDVPHLMPRTVEAMKDLVTSSLGLQRNAQSPPLQSNGPSSDVTTPYSLQELCSFMGVPQDRIDKPIFSTSPEKQLVMSWESDGNDDNNVNYSLLTISTEEAAFVCEYCDRVFQYRPVLVRHQRVHRCCQLCGIHCTSVEEKLRHMRESCRKRDITRRVSVRIQKMEFDKTLVGILPQQYLDQIAKMRAANKSAENILTMDCFESQPSPYFEIDGGTSSDAVSATGENQLALEKSHADSNKQRQNEAMFLQALVGNDLQLIRTPTNNAIAKCRVTSTQVNTKDFLSVFCNLGRAVVVRNLATYLDEHERIPVALTYQTQKLKISLLRYGQLPAKEPEFRDFQHTVPISLPEGHDTNCAEPKFKESIVKEAYNTYQQLYSRNHSKSKDPTNNAEKKQIRLGVTPQVCTSKQTQEASKQSLSPDEVLVMMLHGEAVADNLTAPLQNANGLTELAKNNLSEQVGESNIGVPLAPMVVSETTTNSTMTVLPTTNSETFGPNSVIVLNKYLGNKSSMNKKLLKGIMSGNGGQKNALKFPDSCSNKFRKGSPIAKLPLMEVNLDGLTYSNPALLNIPLLPPSTPSCNSTPALPSPSTPSSLSDQVKDPKLVIAPPRLNENTPPPKNDVRCRVQPVPTAPHSSIKAPVWNPPTNHFESTHMFDYNSVKINNFGVLPRSDVVLPVPPNQFLLTNTPIYSPLFRAQAASLNLQAPMQYTPMAGESSYQPLSHYTAGVTNNGATTASSPCTLPLSLSEPPPKVITHTIRIKQPWEINNSV